MCYHSGLEGYCKSAAKMLEDEGLKLSLCRDILPDRTRNKLARTWCLSNQRRGRGNRMSIFEDWWLGDDGHEGLQLDEHCADAEAVCRCVDGIIDSMIRGRGVKTADGVAGVRRVLGMKDFKERFKNQVIPAIEHGLLCEGYRGTDIMWFRIILEDRLDALPNLAADYSNAEEFRSFLTIIVAALVYGPGHSLVRAGQRRDHT